MSILNDIQIKKLAEAGMINPCGETTLGISSGISSYGYDARLANKLYIFESKEEVLIDPKNFDTRSYQEVISDEHFILPAHGFALGKTVEYFKIPNDILAICLGKSTYARCGIIVNVTPLEPGWEGYVTIELSNTTNFPAKVYANEGICQFVFLQGEQCCVSYSTKRAGKAGKYMGQQDIVLPKGE